MIVNYGSHALVDANVADMPPQARVVVVDNYFSLSERDAIAALCRRRGWEFVAKPDNAGFGAAVNAGVRHAISIGCECLLLLNPDAMVSAEVVDELRRHVLREPDSLVSPRIGNSAGDVVFQGVDLLLGNGRMRRAGTAVSDREPAQLWLTAACLALNTKTFERVQGFDERYFLYWEDVDFSVRAVASGASLVVRHDLIAVHDEGGTHEGARAGRARSDTYYYYNCRNRLLFAALNLPRRRILRWLLTSPAASWEVLLRGGRRQLLHSPRPLLAAVRGTCAGSVRCLPALIGCSSSRLRSTL